MFKYTVYIYIFTCITIKGYNTLLSMGFYDTNTNVIFHETPRGDRDSHSVLGSIFLNPSVAAGVSYGSGGTQIRKAWDGAEPPLRCQKVSSFMEMVSTKPLWQESVLSCPTHLWSLIFYCSHECGWLNCKKKMYIAYSSSKKPNN